MWWDKIYLIECVLFRILNSINNYQIYNNTIQTRCYFPNEELSKISEITFRKVPDGGEESYAFLNFYLPNLDIARKVSKKFKDQGIDACFHYYDNNWHYVRKWDHLKEIKSLYPISAEVKEGLKYLKDKTFDQSDHFIGRNISCLIKLSWSKDEVKKRAEKMVEIIKDSL